MAYEHYSSNVENKAIVLSHRRAQAPFEPVFNPNTSTSEKLAIERVERVFDAKVTTLTRHLVDDRPSS